MPSYLGVLVFTSLHADVYRAAHLRGVTVVGGAARTVGAAGGWALGGGHSPLGYLYGMGVDSKSR